MGRSPGWVAFIIEKCEETVRIEQTRFDPKAGFQSENSAPVLA